MNQILECYKSKLLKKRIYFIQFSILLFIIIICIIQFLFKKYANFKTGKQSESIKKSYLVKQLYSDSFYEDNFNPYIIAFIQIPSININYPILSDYSDELLKITLCKFYGPYPNTIGNLCILGHNYNNNEFFSNLHLLNLEDTIIIQDLNNNKIFYKIVDKYEVEPNNMEFLSQDIGLIKMITLITCDNLNRKALNYKSYRKQIRQVL